MRALIAAVIVMLSAWPALAFDTPKALVAAIYAPYQGAGGGKDQDPTQYYSERLKGLVSAHAAKAAKGVLASAASHPNTGDAAPALSFNPFISGQQSLLMDLSIGDPVVLGDTATVAVSFHNFDQATLLSLSLVKQANGWAVDDVASLGSGQHWLLSWVLQYDPFSIS